MLGAALATGAAQEAPAFRSCSGLTVVPGYALPACPERPNCVTGRVPGDPPQARHDNAPPLAARLRDAILAEPRSRIELAAGELVVATFRSRLFGFVDEAYFRLHDDGSFDYRSGACSGYYDFGVNRRRMTRIMENLGFGPDFRPEAR